MSNSPEFDQMQPIAYNHYQEDLNSDFNTKFIAFLRENTSIDPDKTLSVTIRADRPVTIYWTEVQFQPFPKNTFKDNPDE